MKLQAVKNVLYKFRLRRKTIIIMMLSFLLFLGMLQTLVYFFANPALQHYLPKYSNKNSNGLYTFNFKKLKINIANRSIIIDSIYLQPDTNRYKELNDSAKINNALYDITIDKLEAKGVSLYSLLFNNKIKIKKIEFSEPVIKLIGLPKGFEMDSSKRYDAANRDLFPTLNKYLKSVSIRSIELKKGYFDLFSEYHDIIQTTIANEFDIELKDFLITRENFNTKRKKVFYSDDIIFRLNDYTLQLPDSIHTVTAKLIELSTIRSKLTAQDVQLKPTQISYYNKAPELNNIYDLSIPEIIIEDIDIKKAYLEKKVDISNIILLQPNIKLVAKPKKRNIPKKKINYSEIDLYQLIKGSLNSISVKKFSIQTATFSWYRNYYANEPAYNSKDFSIILTHFHLDSLAVQDSTKLFYSKNIDLGMNDFKMKLVDNIHTLKTKEIRISTAKHRIYANNFEISAPRYLKNRNDNPFYIDVFVPHFAITGFDFKEAYNNKIFNSDYLKISKPLMSFSSEKIKKKNSRKNLYNILNQYFSHYFIKSFHISDGYFNITRNDSAHVLENYRGDLNLGINGFTIQPKKKKVYFEKKATVELDNISLIPGNMNHIFELNKLILSSEDNALQISNLTVRPSNDSCRVAVNAIFDEINFNDFNLDLLFKQEKLQCNSIEFLNPDIILSLNQKMAKRMGNKNPGVKKKIGLNILFDNKVSDTIISNFIVEKLNHFVKSVQIQKFQIKEGSIVALIDSGIYKKPLLQTRIELLNINYLNLDEKNPFNSKHIKENVEFILGHSKINFPKQSHIFEFDKLDMSDSLQNTVITNLQLIPKKGKTTGRNAFHLYAPSVALSKPTSLVGKEGLNYFCSDNVFLKECIISLSENSFPRDQQRNRRVIDGLKFKNASIINGKLKLYKQKKGREYVHLETELNVVAENFVFHFNQDDEQYNLFARRNQKAWLNNFHLLIADSLYNVTSDSIFIDFQKQSADAAGVSVTPVYDDIQKTSRKLILTNNSIFYNFIFDKIHINDIQLNAFFRDKIIDIDKCVLDNSSITVNQLKYLSDKSTIQQQLHKLYNNLQKNYSAININTCLLQNGTIDINYIYLDTIKQYSFNAVNGHIKGFYISENEIYNPAKFYNTDEISLTSGSQEIPITSDYSLKMRDISISTLDSSLSFGRVVISPLNIQGLTNKYTFQKPIYKYNAKDISFQGVDFRRIIENQNYFLKIMQMNDYELYIFLDRRKPYDHSHRPPLPQGYLTMVPLSFTIDSVLFKNGNIIYEEYAPYSKNTSTIELSKFDLSANHLSNNKDFWESNEKIIVDAEGKLMDQGNFAFLAIIPLPNHEEDIIVNGTLSEMPFDALNKYLEASNKLSLRNGKINELQFSIEANEKVAKGDFMMDYTDLKLLVLDDDTTKYSKGLYSFIANSIIKTSNLKTDKGKFRPGYMYFKRDVSKNFVHYFLSAILTGIKSTFGFYTKEMRLDMKKQRRKENIEKLKNITRVPVVMPNTTE